MHIITTARKPTPALLDKAITMGTQPGLTYIKRHNLSLHTLVEQFGQVLVLSQNRLSCYTREGELFFHPNLAALRIKNLRQGSKDLMSETMGLVRGSRVLDCTAGLGADSLVACYQVGPEGEVAALEASLPIYLVVKEGIANYTGPQRLQALAQRIKLVHANFREFLPRLEPKTYDIVYFDPMFDVPVGKSSALAPLRPLANCTPLTKADIEQAAQVATKAVVVKQRSFYNFNQLGLSRVTGGKGSTIAYGILDLGGTD